MSSIIDSVKAAIGMEEETGTYECQECGTTFESTMDDADSYWLKCPECSSEDVVAVESA